MVVAVVVVLIVVVVVVVVVVYSRISWFGKSSHIYTEMSEVDLKHLVVVYFQ